MSTLHDQPLLIAEGLSKNYGARIGCRDVSLAVHPGEVLAVVGESGSGRDDDCGASPAISPRCPSACRVLQ